MVTAVGALLGVLGALFLALGASGLAGQLAEVRAARRRRRARALVTALAAGDAAGRPGERPRGAPLALARELVAILPDAAPEAGSGAMARAREVLREQLVTQLARRAERWHGAPFRRRRLRSDLLAGLALLEELPAEEDLPLVVHLLYLPDPLIVARAAAVVARRPHVYTGAMVPLAGILRAVAPLSRPHVEHALRALAATHPEMIPMLASDPSAVVRRNIVLAAAAAMQIPTPHIDQELRDRLANLIVAGGRDPEWEVRIVACRALQRLPSAQRLAELGRLLHDDSVSVQVAATQSLRAVPDPEAVPSLVARLEGATPALTREILQALAALPALPRSEIDWLVSRLAQGVGAARVAALRALGSLGGAAEAISIVQLVQDRNPKVRLEASLALAAIGRLPELPLRGTEVVERLCHRLPLEPDERVAAGLAQALASSGDARATAPLIARIKDSSPILREQLVEGLALSNLLTTARARVPEMA